jgi:hypothetical protein
MDVVMDHQQGIDPYGLLGVTSESTASDARKAYYALALLAHPDRGGNSDDMRAVHQAYRYVSNQLVDADEARARGVARVAEPSDIPLPSWQQVLVEVQAAGAAGAATGDAGDAEDLSPPCTLNAEVFEAARRDGKVMLAASAGGYGSVMDASEYAVSEGCTQVAGYDPVPGDMVNAQPFGAGQLIRYDEPSAILASDAFEKCMRSDGAALDPEDHDFTMNLRGAPRSHGLPLYDYRAAHTDTVTDVDAVMALMPTPTSDLEELVKKRKELDVAYVSDMPMYILDGLFD